MKLSRGLVVLGIFLVGALLFGAYSAASAPLPEGFPTPTADGEIEVKQYPAYRSATVQVNGDFGSASSRGFSPLFRHISDNDISMTAPVEAQYPAATLQADAASQGSNSKFRLTDMHFASARDEFAGFQLLRSARRI